MRDGLLSEIETICIDNNVSFKYRYDEINNMLRFIFTKEDKSIMYIIECFEMVHQPEWVTIKNIKTCIEKLYN